MLNLQVACHIFLDFRALITKYNNLQCDRISDRIPQTKTSSRGNSTTNTANPKPNFVWLRRSNVNAFSPSYGVCSYEAQMSDIIDSDKRPVPLVHYGFAPLLLLSSISYPERVKSKNQRYSAAPFDNRRNANAMSGGQFHACSKRRVINR